MRIVTWNVNSIRLRIEQFASFALRYEPDVIWLQETKVVDDLFPRQAVHDAGFEHQAIYGQPGYNGVAILSRWPLKNIKTYEWLNSGARHISARISSPTLAEPVEVHSLYVPAGGDIPDVDKNPKFAHKLAFLDAVSDFFAATYGFSDRLVLAGDFNVAPLPNDVWNHQKMRRIITHTPVEVEKLSRLQSSLKWIYAPRKFIPEDEHLFTWWSYRSKD